MNADAVLVPGLNAAFVSRIKVNDGKYVLLLAMVGVGIYVILF